MRFAFTITEFGAAMHVPGAVAQSQTHILEIPDEQLPAQFKQAIERIKTSTNNWESITISVVLP